MVKNLSNKFGQKLFDSAKKSSTDKIKTASKRTIKKKTAEATGDLISNKIADKITNISNKKSPINNDEKEEDVDIITRKKRYMSPEERQQITDELRLVLKNYWWMDVNTIAVLQCIKMQYQKIVNN